MRGYMTYKRLGTVEALVLTAGAWPLNQKEDTTAATNKLLIPSSVRIKKKKLIMTKLT
jgi:hypothetical protein